VPALVAGYGFPAQNLVAADAAGRILWTPLGRGPRRFGWDGRFPVPGWRADVGWDGLYEAAVNPVLVDPPAGAVATANSRLPAERPPWFAQDFDTPFRLDRILERLAARDRWPLDAFAELQLDVGSHWARRLVAELEDAELGGASRLDGRLDGDAARAAAALAGWDGEMAERGPSALFALVERELQRAIFEDEAEREGLGRFGTRKRLLALLDGRISVSWYDDVATPEVEGREATIAAALAAAWRAGSARWGEDVGRWSYGEIHSLTLGHPLDGLPLVGRWWRRGPYPVGGSATTIAAFGGPWRGDALDVAYGPSMRFVTDAADPSRTLWALPGGQSGHPADPHYDDRIADYLAGRFQPLPWSEEAIEAARVSRLALVPALAPDR
jgi:penicillin amidase